MSLESIGANGQEFTRTKGKQGVHWQDTEKSLADPSNRKAASAQARRPRNEGAAKDLGSISVSLSQGQQSPHSGEGL